MSVIQVIKKENKKCVPKNGLIETRVTSPAAYLDMIRQIRFRNYCISPSF